jgi:aryl-alcohol dehydrogenase-like predicted oxidoreductase
MTETHSSRVLGATGLEVSPLGVGTNKWMYGKNDQQVLQVFEASVNTGVNFLDTPEIKGFGKSERLLGSCVEQTVAGCDCE